MFGSLLGFISQWPGVIAEWAGAIAAFLAFIFAVRQLHVIKMVNGATFIRELYKDFWTNDADILIAALRRGDLEIVETVSSYDMRKDQRKVFSEHEVTRYFLNPLENLGALSSRKLIKIDLIYDFFSRHISLVWTNDKIQALIVQMRKKPDDWDRFSRLEALYYKCKVYGDREALWHDKMSLSKRAPRLIDLVSSLRIRP